MVMVGNGIIWIISVESKVSSQKSFIPCILSYEGGIFNKEKTAMQNKYIFIFEINIILLKLAFPEYLSKVKYYINETNQML